MRRFIAHILLGFALLIGVGGSLTAQELRLGADFTTLFDNTEYASMEGISSGTLFGARLTPSVGIGWSEHNEVMVGVDLYQDFGHAKFLSDAKLQLYYSYRAPRVKLYAGLFPRNAMRGLSTPLFFDPAYCYYNNSIGGVLARYEEAASGSYIEFAMDYTGMRSFDTREAFAIMSSGEHHIPVSGSKFLYGYDLYVGHYAKDYNPDTIDGVVDNILLRPHIGFGSNNTIMLGKHPFNYELELSYVQSLQRDRINENSWEHPFGGELYIGLEWAGIELSNRLYVGRSSLLSYYNRYGSDVYHGVALYNTHKGIYDAIALSYDRWFFNQTVGVKAGITMEYDGAIWGTRQWLQVSARLNYGISLKRNRVIE